MLKIVALCLVLLHGCLCQEEVTISIDMSTSRVYPGQDVEFICRATNVPADGIIYWFKTVKTGKDENDQIENVGMGSQALPPYDRFSRLMFKDVSAGTTKIYSLTITGVKEEDAGHWGCSYREPEDNIYETDMFEVYNNIDQMILSLNGSIVDDDEDLEVLAGDNTHLEIISGRTLPDNHVSVYVGDKDITRQLYQVAHTNVECPTDLVKKNCSLHWSRNTTVAGQYNFTGHEDLSTLTVIGKVIGAKMFKPVNKTYKLIVDHAPLFGCMTKPLVRRGVNFTLSCTVNARPVADTYYWHMSKDGKDVYAMPGQYIDDWNALVTMKHVDETTCEMSLVLYMVTDYHFNTEYHLVAGNEHGNETLAFTIIEDFSPIAEPNSASVLVSSLLAVMTTVLVTLSMKNN